MSKQDKRENIILIASEPLTFEQGLHSSFCRAFRQAHTYPDMI